ncbi:MAG: VOC family protein [Pseudomonadota bacterium]
MVRLALLAALLALSPTQSAPLVDAGYQEAVFSVSSLPAYSTFFRDVAGWEQLAAGPVPRQQLDAWRLAKDVSARFTVFGNRGTNRGFVRLIEFTNVAQKQIRSNAQSWDTGGWFDVNTRVANMSAKFAELQADGWQATSDPVQFRFGPFVVIEWLARGPDGIVLAMIERVQPPLEGYPELRELSRLFNATQVVTDLDDAQRFYIDTLGFKTYLEHRGASPEEGPNVLGIPHNLADDIERDVVIVHPHGINEGSVELLAFDGLTGADFAANAAPPNLGILMLRFPASDIEVLHARLVEHRVEVVYPPTDIDLEPYGDVRMLGIRGPGGAWLEFYETRATR